MGEGSGEGFGPRLQALKVLPSRPVLPEGQDGLTTCCQLFILISGVLGTISQRAPGPSSLQVLG